jgi:hypothetical protein
VVAVYANETDLAATVKHLEHAGYDMSSISVLGKGMIEERHVVGFETQGNHAARWGPRQPGAGELGRSFVIAAAVAAASILGATTAYRRIS